MCQTGDWPACRNTTSVLQYRKTWPSALGLISQEFARVCNPHSINLPRVLTFLIGIRIWPLTYRQYGSKDKSRSHKWQRINRCNKPRGFTRSEATWRTAIMSAWSALAAWPALAAWLRIRHSIQTVYCLAGLSDHSFRLTEALSGCKQVEPSYKETIHEVALTTLVIQLR